MVCTTGPRAAPRFAPSTPTIVTIGMLHQTFKTMHCIILNCDNKHIYPYYIKLKYGHSESKTNIHMNELFQTERCVLQSCMAVSIKEDTYIFSISYKR